MLYFHKPVVDKYMAAPINIIIVDKEEGCYRKKTSDNETLVARDVQTDHPQVYGVYHSVQYLPANLVHTIPVTRTHTYSVDDEVKKSFLDELNAHKNILSARL